MIVGVNQLFQFDIINNIVTFAATWHSKDVLQWDNFSFCLDSLVSCGSLCRKVSLSPFLSLSLSHSLTHKPQSLFWVIIALLMLLLLLPIQPCFPGWAPKSNWNPSFSLSLPSFLSNWNPYSCHHQSTDKKLLKYWTLLTTKTRAETT